MYAKLFASLYQGTLRGHSDEILVFCNLLANCDVFGIVDKHWNAISDEVGISVERVKTAIEHLEAVDPESRSPDSDGRRIVKMDEHRAWGWKIVNYQKYRAIRSEDDRREQNRAAQARYRDRNKPKTDKEPKPPSAAVSKSKPAPEPIELPDWVDAEQWRSWLKVRPARARTVDAQKAALKKLEGFRAAGHDPNAIVGNSLANGYQGLIEPKVSRGNGQQDAKPLPTCPRCLKPVLPGDQWTMKQDGKVHDRCTSRDD